MPGGICQCQLGSGSVGRRVQPALPVVLATAEVGLQVPPVGCREMLALDLAQQRLEVARAARRAAPLPASLPSRSGSVTGRTHDLGISLPAWTPRCWRATGAWMAWSRPRRWIRPWRSCSISCSCGAMSTSNPPRAPRAAVRIQGRVAPAVPSLLHPAHRCPHEPSALPPFPRNHR